MNFNLLIFLNYLMKFLLIIYQSYYLILIKLNHDYLVYCNIIFDYLLFQVIFIMRLSRSYSLFVIRCINLSNNDSCLRNTRQTVVFMGVQIILYGLSVFLQLKDNVLNHKNYVKYNKNYQAILKLLQFRDHRLLIFIVFKGLNVDRFQLWLDFIFSFNQLSQGIFFS